MSKLARLTIRRPLDGFTLCLAGVVFAATVQPCKGQTAAAFHLAGILAIGLLFFLQGARLSRDAVLHGIVHWRLHAAINATTYLLFPLLGLSLIVAFPHLLPPALVLGVLFLCALPSTVQSSIALVSIAGGNVPAAVCSATASNIAGIVLAPLLFGAMANLHGGGGVDLRGLWQVILQLLVPFAAGHLLRPRIGEWAERNRGVLSITDRGSILLVVYGAFSAAVVRGVWLQMPLQVLAALAVLMGLLLALVIAITIGASRAMGLPKEDEAALVFCGSQKSLVSGVPIANALVSGPSVGLILLPLMLYYPMQLVICAWLARRYANDVPRRAALFPREASTIQPVAQNDGGILIEPLTEFARSVVRDNIRTPLP
jgi:solute carrier family 10 (sodium/bile acid cotransporter), member 7